MEKPLDGTKLPTEVGQRVIDKPDLPPQGISTDNEVYTTTIEGQMQLKMGTDGKFEVLCDEPARVGGTDKHPYPMTYLAMATGF